MDWQKLIDRFIKIFFTLLVSIGLIGGPSGMPSPMATATRTPSSTATPHKTFTPTPEAATLQPTIFPTATITPTLDPQSLRPEPGSVCGYDPLVESLMGDLEQDGWVHWIELLSGEKPVRMNGETYTILTRYSEAMFSGNPNARAYEFVLEQLRQWGYQDDLDLFEQAYQPFVPESKSTWKNIVVLIPGKDPAVANEQILLTAHLDSISMGHPEERAPGADDNGSGVATLLEAARIFRGLEFKRTIKIVFFTGEELGLFGSKAYVSGYAHELDDILGVFNLDMFGYDADQDRCFEIHVGWMPESNQLGGCLADIIEEYGINLKFDYIVQEAISASDHATFWQQGIGAIEVLENFSTNGFPNGCGERDFNPYYHTEKDLVENLNLDTGHTIAKAAIAAVARLAEISQD